MSDESDSTIELNRRRVLAGLGTIGVASAGAGAGTFALFSDTETSSGNTVQAGTLDLSNGFSSSSLTIDGGGSGLKPGDQNTAVFTLTNDGTLNGSLDLKITNVGSSQSITPASNEGAVPGEFDIDFGVTGGQTNFGPGAGDLIRLGDVGLNTQSTDVSLDTGSGNHTIEVTTGMEITASTGGSVEVVLDTDNDGFGDIRVGYQPGGSGSSYDANGFYYKRATEQDGFFVGKQAGTPAEVSSANYSGETFTVTLDGGNSNVSSSSIGIGGQAIYSGGATNKDFDGNQLYTPIVPSKAAGDEFGQVGARNADSGELVTVDGTLRTIDDVIKTSFVLDPDFGTDQDVHDGDETVIADSGDSNSTPGMTRVAEGRPSRFEDVEFDMNASLDSGNTRYLVVEYEVPTDAGNAIQGEQLNFDIEVELNQEDSQ